MINIKFFLFCIMCMCVCVPEHRCPRGPEASNLPEDGVMGVCEPSDVDPGN